MIFFSIAKTVDQIPKVAGDLLERLAYLLNISWTWVFALMTEKRNIVLSTCVIMKERVPSLQPDKIFPESCGKFKEFRHEENYVMRNFVIYILHLEELMQKTQDCNCTCINVKYTFYII